MGILSGRSPINEARFLNKGLRTLDGADSSDNQPSSSHRERAVRSDECLPIPIHQRERSAVETLDAMCFDFDYRTERARIWHGGRWVMLKDYLQEPCHTEPKRTGPEPSRSGSTEPSAVTPTTSGHDGSDSGERN